MGQHYYMLGSAIVGLLASTIRVLRIGSRPKGYPPGPPTLPLLGNIHQMPSWDAHSQFEKWAREYGPVYSLMSGTKVLIVLSSDVAVKELSDKRSAIYSDRQDMYIAQMSGSGGLRMLMMGYTPTWRTFRKHVHNLLNITVSRSYEPYQMLENRQMLYELSHSPQDFSHHIRRYSNASTTTMVFGWRTPTYEDPKMQQSYDGFAEFAALANTGTAAFVDFYPWLRRSPDWMSHAQREAKRLFARERRSYVGHWSRAKEQVRDGSIRPCFCVGLAAAQEKDGFSDDQAAYVSGTLLEAGSDTTASTLYGFVQAMVSFPEVQRKAQEEIERVVGKGRSPTMRDESDLNYVRCCVKESLRWMPATILGAVPHAVTKDDEYMGYTIPKGAGVMNNVWAINMDPVRHPEPRRFNPDRYKDDQLSVHDSATNPDPTKRDNFTFGAGRRICPGMHVAERSLFSGISRMSWAFDITPAVDASGEPIMPDSSKLTQGFDCCPEEFPATITPRSKERAEIVEREWREVEAEQLDPVTKQWKVMPHERKEL